MKKIFLVIALLTNTFFVNAQISLGGLPKSMVSGSQEQYVPVITYNAPDLNDLISEDIVTSRMDPKPYKAGILLPADISFPSSGSLTTLPDGSTIWKAKVVISDAPALAFYYDQFHLPQGVKYYLSNKNGRQILGAYTSDNNAPDGLFASQEVQGEEVNLELNIEPGVPLEAIKLHINQAAFLYRSVEYLQQYATVDDGIVLKPGADFAAGSSSVCGINAICPEGSDYEAQRKATVRILMPLGNNYVTFCTGTLINNTKGDCTPYVLTASHCEGTNSKNDGSYSQWIFYFNFEAPDCAGAGTAPNTLTITGASFIARSDYDSTYTSIIGDFLLLKLRSAVPARFGTYFAGWNIDSDLPATSRYTNFHHPAGDMKKLAVASFISPNGVFNQFNVRGTHWGLSYETGGNEGGSSGSALFDIDGRIVGTLSGGSDIQGCVADTNSRGEYVVFGQDALFSKISRNWTYPESNGAANGQLKPWLDPDNSGVTTINSIVADNNCTYTATSITNRNEEPERFVSIYPNPVTDGKIKLKVNFDNSSRLKINIYDISGAIKATYQIDKALSGEYIFDISNYPSGTYLISVNQNDRTNIIKKIALVR